MTTSIRYLAVIVYFLSKQNWLENNYRQLYKRSQISIQNKGVMTIKLHKQGRRTTRSERNLDRDGVGGARDEWAAKND
jgi:hypothetical protein